MKLENEIKELAKKQRIKRNLNNVIDSDSDIINNIVYEYYYDEDFMNGQVIGIPFKFIFENKLLIVLFVIVMLFYGLYDEYSNQNLLNNVSKIVNKDL